MAFNPAATHALFRGERQSFLGARVRSVTDVFVRAHVVEVPAGFYSRLVIDCNRDPAAADSIAEVSEATAIPGNRALSAAERKARREAIFDLYHGAIAALLEQGQDRRSR